ncbi:MAG TPA: TspO protein [Flavobacteriales bacterium]|jgi:benzodiazapine receptor|nr:TspO protein [Flavobacteriales bacterium]
MHRNVVLSTVVFLILNFLALAIGGLFTGKGVPSDWYMALNKAPWTPPGWVFGFAWTFIMICFSVYMAFFWQYFENKKLLIGLFAVQWVLNVLWNPVFFHFHQITAGLLVISLLTVLVGYLLYFSWPYIGYKALLILPYVIWLLIATSLNGYVVFHN